VQLASGLPLGYTGTAEVMDVILTKSMPAEDFFASVTPTLPVGLAIKGIEEVFLKAPSLQSALRQAMYRVTLETSLSGDELTDRISDLLAADQIERQRIRKGREETFDLRPLVDDVGIEVVSDGRAVLCMRLSAGQHGNVRPDEVLAALGLEHAHSQVERTQLRFEFDSL
jgi:radical SAM-linked protein